MKKGDLIFKTILLLMTVFTLSILIIIIGYIFKEAYSFLKIVPFKEFILKSKWEPVTEEGFGILPVILGTLVTSLVGLIISMPIAIFVSLFLTKIKNQKISFALMSFLDNMAGLPSVIVGFMGMIFLVKFIENTFKLSAGESILAAALVLVIIMLPFEISQITESLKKSKSNYNLYLKGLNLDEDYSLVHVILPSIKATIISASIVALSRGFGETMAVMMVIGNANIFKGLLSKGQTIPGRIALEMGMVTVGSTHYSALFAMALILMVIVLLTNSLAIYIKNKWE